MAILFQWDLGKAALNVGKHGVTFESAARVLYDPLAIVELDRIENGEQRWKAIGMADAFLLLVVAHT